MAGKKPAPPGGGLNAAGEQWDSWPNSTTATSSTTNAPTTRFSAASVASRRPATSRLELVGKRSEPSWPGEGTVFPFSIVRLERAQLEKPGTVMEAFVVE